MIARTAATVAAGGVLRRCACQPPLTLRRVRTADPSTCALCLVGTAAGPLAGDDLSLRLELEDSAHAVLHATGASIAQGRGPGRSARLRIAATIGAGASLRADPGPLVACQGSCTEVSVRIRLAASSELEWRELVVLGRSGSPTGAVRLRWDVSRDDRPLLRQEVDLADPYLSGWDGMLRGRRVLASSLLAGPGIEARTLIQSPTAVAQPLGQRAALLTVLATGAAEATRDLDQLVRSLRDGG